MPSCSPARTRTSRTLMFAVGEGTRRSNQSAKLATIFHFYCITNSTRTNLLSCMFHGGNISKKRISWTIFWPILHYFYVYFMLTLWLQHNFIMLQCMQYRVVLCKWIQTYKKNQNATSCLNPFSNDTGGRRPEPGLGRGRCMATTNIGHELFPKTSALARGGSQSAVGSGCWL